ncbi:hypothetical protein GGI35DRAFT_24328 [Trichoderma velutinum]
MSLSTSRGTKGTKVRHTWAGSAQRCCVSQKGLWGPFDKEAGSANGHQPRATDTIPYGTKMLVGMLNPGRMARHQECLWAFFRPRESRTASGRWAHIVYYRSKAYHRAREISALREGTIATWAQSKGTFWREHVLAMASVCSPCPQAKTNPALNPIRVKRVACQVWQYVFSLHRQALVSPGDSQHSLYLSLLSQDLPPQISRLYQGILVQGQTSPRSPSPKDRPPPFCQAHLRCKGSLQRPPLMTGCRSEEMVRVQSRKMQLLCTQKYTVASCQGDGDSITSLARANVNRLNRPTAPPRNQIAPSQHAHGQWRCNVAVLQVLCSPGGDHGQSAINMPGLPLDVQGLSPSLLQISPSAILSHPAA